MKILALEFSSAQRSVAFFDSQTCAVTSTAEMGGRSTRAFGLIEQVLQKAGVSRDAIDCVAIGLGPGSYTGIRAGISIAQGWQLAREIKTIGISSVQAVSTQAQREGMRGIVNVIVDAQRNEFYIAAYHLSEDGSEEVEALRIVTADEVKARINAGTTILAADATAAFPGLRCVYPDAAIIAQLAAKSDGFVSGEKIEPIYLRETTFVKAPSARVIS